MFNIYAVLTPIAISLVLIEMIYCWVTKKDYYTFQDAISSFGTAIVNQTVNLVVAALVFKSYGYLHDNYAIMNVDANWKSAIVLIVLIDFLFYWFHRAGHSINIFWAAHSPHHSTEEMNLAVALRASVTQRLFSFTFFWPLPLLGFSPEFIYTMTGIHLINGYWHHTRTIGKLGWFEKWFNTPSHHRVHHGTNAQYLDRNMAELLIIWDKLFGTFEEEREEVNYGILRHPGTWGPLGINFHFWGMLWQDMKETPKLWDKFRLWFMPLGWRPPGVSYREPVRAYTKEEYTKFDTKMFPKSRVYLVIQLILGVGVMAYIIDGKSPLVASEKFIMSALMWAMVIAWGGILEMKKWAPKLEVFRIIAMGGAMMFFIQKYHSLSLQKGIIPAIVIASIFWVVKNFKAEEEVEVSKAAA